MKTNNYFQPQTCVERTLPQIVILQTVGESHNSETIPQNPPTPGGGGLSAPRRL